MGVVHRSRPCLSSASLRYAAERARRPKQTEAEVEEAGLGVEVAAVDAFARCARDEVDGPERAGKVLCKLEAAAHEVGIACDQVAAERAVGSVLVVDVCRAQSAGIHGVGTVVAGIAVTIPQG